MQLKGEEFPLHNKGVLKELGATQHFDESFGDDISQWAVLRNILAHEYLDIRWNTIKNFIQTSEPIYKTFINKVEFMLHVQ